MLQHHAVVCGSLVLALVVLTKVDINMIQLEETRQVSGCLGLALGNVVDARSPQQKVALLPGLFAILLQP